MAQDTMEVRDARNKERFELVVDGEVAGFAAYRLDGDRFTFTHTEVSDEHEGEGLGSRLVGDALRQVADRGGSVVPECPFVRAYIAKHDEHRSIVPESDRARFDLA
jgi:predicted GNAT family acetyltransferase